MKCLQYTAVLPVWMWLSVQGGLEPCSGCVFSTKYFFFFFLQKLVDELKNRAHGFQCPSCISHSIFTLGANAVFSPFYNNSIFTTLFISTVIMTPLHPTIQPRLSLIHFFAPITLYYSCTPKPSPCYCSCLYRLWNSLEILLFVLPSNWFSFNT